jgi:hypothetical protein
MHTCYVNKLLLNIMEKISLRLIFTIVKETDTCLAILHLLLKHMQNVLCVNAYVTNAYHIKSKMPFRSSKPLK